MCVNLIERFHCVIVGCIPSPLSLYGSVVQRDDRGTVQDGGDGREEWGGGCFVHI